MTPYLTRKAIVSLVDGQNTQAWMNATLARAKKIPKLEELLSKKSIPKTELEDKMKNAFKMMGTHTPKKGK